MKDIAVNRRVFINKSRNEEIKIKSSQIKVFRRLLKNRKKLRVRYARITEIFLIEASKYVLCLHCIKTGHKDSSTRKGAVIHQLCRKIDGGRKLVKSNNDVLPLHSVLPQTLGSQGQNWGMIEANLSCGKRLTSRDEELL